MHGWSTDIIRKTVLRQAPRGKECRVFVQVCIPIALAQALFTSGSVVVYLQYRQHGTDMYGEDGGEFI